MTQIARRTVAPGNRILLQLPAPERQRVVAIADRIRLPVRHLFARAGDVISSAYFPDRGVLSLVSEMRTGHKVAVAAVGREGVIGLGPLLGLGHYPSRVVVLVETEGHVLPVAEFRRLLDHSEVLRPAILAHIGQRISELTITAACHRVHSHRQRLARWLLVISDRAGQQWLAVTHDTLAQMVGGPRHAVTVALKELRAAGAIAHARGRIEIVNRPGLIAQACECYGRHPDVALR